MGFLLPDSPDPKPAPPPPQRTTLEDIDNALRRQRRRAEQQGRASLVTGISVPTGGGTGFQLPGGNV